MKEQDLLVRPLIGLFGGTFDPVHLGHLILAQIAIEELALEQLIFIPAKISPHKEITPPCALEKDRMAMLELGCGNEHRFSIDDRELRREGNSYAIDTVRELQKENPLAKFIYLIGEDNVSKLSTWKESDELQQRVAFAVLRRSSNALLQPHSFPIISRCIDISSTEIRERLAKGRSVRYLLSTPVFKYIEERRLYQKKN